MSGYDHGRRRQGCRSGTSVRRPCRTTSGRPSRRSGSARCSGAWPTPARSTSGAWPTPASTPRPGSPSTTWRRCRSPPRPTCGTTTRGACSPSRVSRCSASTARRGRAGGRPWWPTPAATWPSGPRCAPAPSAAPGTITHVGYGYGLFTGGLGMHQGAELMGCTVIPASAGQTQRQVTLIRDLKPEVLCCTPSYAARLGEALAEAGVAKDEISLRAGIFGAEPWSEAMRAQIEAVLPLKALDIYGLSEIIGPGVSCECVEAQAGVPQPHRDEGVRCSLHVNEDHFLVEVIDPDTGAPLPPRTRGELVFTTLTKEAMPLLRYRTGDIAALDRTPCVCGRTLARMSKVFGRVDDMLVIRGVNVYPSEVEAVVVAARAVAPHYLLVVDRTETMPKLVVACELAADWTVGAETEEGERERVAAEVGAALLERLGLTTEVRVLPGGTIPRVELGKAQRVVDRTREHDPLRELSE